MRASICVLTGILLVSCNKPRVFSAQEELIYHCSQPEPGSVQIVEKALEEGAQIELRDEFGRTPFLAASYGIDDDRSYASPTGEVSEKSNNPALLGGAPYQDESIKVLRLLAEHGANIHELESFKQTAMHLAASRNRDKVIEYLISSGHAINQPDSLGYSPLMIAVSTKNVRATIAILKHNPDLSMRSIYHQDVFALAEETQNDTLIKALRSTAKQ
jgi:ankyrin repeat protein